MYPVAPPCILIFVDWPTDSNWASCPNTWYSVWGYVWSLGSGTVSWLISDHLTFSVSIHLLIIINNTSALCRMYSGLTEEMLIQPFIKKIWLFSWVNWLIINYNSFLTWLSSVDLTLLLTRVLFMSTCSCLRIEHVEMWVMPLILSEGTSMLFRDKWLILAD